MIDSDIIAKAVTEAGERFQIYMIDSAGDLAAVLEALGFTLSNLYDRFC